MSGADTELHDFDNMSDEDFVQLENPPANETVDDSNGGNTSAEPDNQDEDYTVDAQQDTQETDEQGEELPDTQPASEDIPVEDSEGKPNNESPAKESAADVPAMDYKAEYNKIMAPFKANGVELQIRNAEDAIRLMQMGAGFYDKMTALKPVRKTVKLLEKHNLLDPDKLNFLIDLADKKPEAITKLLRDSNIDPLDINLKDEVRYTPTQRTVSDIELELDNVLADIQYTPTYNKTLTVLTQDWDESSQNTIATTPNIIKVINGHMQDGTFDKVMGAVKYERSLGRLQGVSDFEAYKTMGDMLYQQGQLTLPEQPAVISQQSIPKPVVSKPEQPSVQDHSRQKSKQAARPTKATGSAGSQTMSLSALSEMSDEDFAKLSLKDLQTT